MVSARDAVVQLLPAAVKLPAARQVPGVMHQTYAELPIPWDTLFVGQGRLSINVHLHGLLLTPHPLPPQVAPSRELIDAWCF